jgi:hypothetical protein
MQNKKSLKFLILAPSHPIPINNGSHLDTLGLIETLANFESQVLVMSFSKKSILETFNSITISSVPRSRNIFKLIFGLLPWQASSRKLSSKQIAMGLKFAPDYIVCIQEYAFVSLRQIERVLDNTPRVILRRANEEIKFIRAARAGATIAKRIYLMLEEFRFYILKNKWDLRSELELWDIASDFESRSHQIKKNTGPVFPTLPYDLSQKKINNEKIIIYIGNLSLGHCIEGLRWFIENCWGSITKQEPESKLMLAGLNPTNDFKEFAQSHGVQIIPNPVDTDKLLINSSIFINPIFQGSGVNMKLCRPAQFEIPIVSTLFGARGYIDKLKSLKVTNDPNEFTRLIVELLRNQTLQKVIGGKLKSEIGIFLGSNKQNEIYKILSEKYNED